MERIRRRHDRRRPQPGHQGTDPADPREDRGVPGTDKGRLLTAQIWIKDLARDFEGTNEVGNAWTAPNAAPTHATAQCEMGAPDVLVEIIVTAVVSQ